MQYRAGPRDDYIIRPIDDLTLVHHRPAGMTHVVTPVIAAILGVLAGESMSPEDVVAALGRDHRFDEDAATVLATIAARLAEMARLDLIDCAQ